MSENKSYALADFGFLDQQDFVRKYTANNRIRFYVEGVSCGKCVRKIEDLAVKVDGLKRIRVDLARGLTEAEIESETLSYGDLAREIQKLGFNPIPIAPETSADELRKSEDRSELIRLAVAAACAGNIMTFSFANYLGAPPEFAVLFSWVSFALYLPVVFYVAIPFYRGALASLRESRVSIDLPMAVASISGFIFSTIELLRNRNDIYFDSISGFLFLILLSRFGQKRLQRKFLRPQELAETLNLARVRLVQGEGWTWIPVEKLKAGQAFRLSAGETLPAEAELDSGKSHFSLAWLSGESRPRTFLRGATVPAGARLMTDEAHLIARKPLAETEFGKILTEVQNYSLSNNPSVNLADRWSQWLLTYVFGIAVVFLIGYWTVSPEEAIGRALALIIIACPCALAFGTPLALAASLKKAQKKGLLVRDAGVFDECTKIKSIYFDKTGTLTDSEMNLMTDISKLPGSLLGTVLALENESAHPVAFAFRRAVGDHAVELPRVDNWKEIPGQGVSGYVGGKFFELRKAGQPGFHTTSTLYEEGFPVYNFTFSTRMKAGTREILDGLRADGLNVYLLSGDRRQAAEEIGRELGFSAKEIIADSCPLTKAQTIANDPDSMMVGDGVNDSLAMMRARVGVAVSGGMETALKSADVYLSDSGLEGVTDLLRIGRGASKLIRRNLIISAVYNFTAGTLALLGFVNPLVAALLMPVSSGFILLSTWIEGRRA